MDVHLFNNADGTSTGFMVTKDEIVMVFKDKIFRARNTTAGMKRIEKAMDMLEVKVVKKPVKRRKRREEM